MPVNIPWIGVDLDGTLAVYDEWQGAAHIGAPVPRMVARIKTWLREGTEVRIFTARVAGLRGGEVEAVESARLIGEWCAEHIGVALKVTNEKDFGMIQLWDDRCIQVLKNTGLAIVIDG